jgi:hypothetical protein
MYYGDPFYLGETWTSSIGTECYEMPTAIVRIYTSEGFVIAGDGRARDETGRILTENQQKVFPIVDSNRALCYSMNGMPRVYNPADQGETLVDLVAQADQSGKSLQAGNPANLNSYARKFCRMLRNSLHAANRKNETTVRLFPTLNPYQSEPGSHVILYVYFDGYYKGIPGQVDAIFFHRNQTVASPDVSKNLNLQPSYKVHGSLLVANSLLTPTFDPRLSAYRTAAMSKPLSQITLAEAVEIAAQYIRACDSEIGREIDPVLAPGIGGHIHIATITPNHGFEWAQGYEPVQPVANGVDRTDEDHQQAPSGQNLASSDPSKGL